MLIDHLQVGEEAEEAVLSVLSAEDFITVPGGGKNAFVQQSLHLPAEEHRVPRWLEERPSPTLPV